MILIDKPMPQNCYECPIMMHCDDCEGYNNRCPLDDSIDCGYVVRRGEVVKKDRSYDTLWFRHPKCPLKEVIRCGECKHWVAELNFCNWHDRETDRQWFCADGERGDE